VAASAASAAVAGDPKRGAAPHRGRPGCPKEDARDHSRALDDGAPVPAAVSRRRNYGFERRRRQDIQRAKQAAKQARKTERAASGTTGPEMGEAQSTGAPEGLWEWFSPSRTRTVTTEPKQRPPAEGLDDWVLLTDVDEEPPPDGS
jgi:hypothetical protein